MNNSILEALSNNGFKPIDYVVFVAYLAILIFLGFFLSRSKDGKEKDSKDYFLAGNTLTWWAVGARNRSIRAYGSSHPAGCR